MLHPTLQFTLYNHMMEKSRLNVYPQHNILDPTNGSGDIRIYQEEVQIFFAAVHISKK